MSYSKNVWNQIKNITVEQLMKGLEKDGWEKDNPSSARIPYVKRGNNNELLNRVVIHYHPKKTFGEKLLKGLLNQIGWSSEDLKRLKLIKRL